jgi:hypothetical protein
MGMTPEATKRVSSLIKNDSFVRSRSSNYPRICGVRDVIIGAPDRNRRIGSSLEVSASEWVTDFESSFWVPAIGWPPATLEEKQKDLRKEVNGPIY